MTAFQTDVYEQIRDGARRSARIVAPRLAEQMRFSRGGAPPSPPYRVLDVGCGEGWWGAALLGLGHDVESLDQAKPDVVAPGIDVLLCDLEEPWTMKRAPYDLVVCLEVAEHLSPAGGENLVESLCKATHRRGIIAWSAAIPGQRGHGHVNERWPDYWDERFRSHGWMLTDPLRDLYWDDPDVEPWYSQNLLLAVHGTSNGTWWGATRGPRRLVHPTIWANRVGDVDYWREEALAAKREVESFAAREEA